MSTIAREQLRERAREKVKSLEFAVTQTAFADSRSELEEELELARIALVSLEAEPVGYFGRFDADDEELIDQCSPNISGAFPLYAAPPAPVSVPDEMTIADVIMEIDAKDADRWTGRIGFQKGWNACIAAMHQGTANSPVIPDGWVMVPVEPTEDMIVNGFESEPDESFSDAEVWEAYDAMSGCQQAAHRAKLCWSAMLAAAPKPEA